MRFALHNARHGRDRRRLAPWMLVALLVLLPAGCGDDDDDGGPTVTTEDQVEQGLAGLATIGTRIQNMSETQVLGHSSVAPLFSALGLELPETGLTPGAKLLPTSARELVKGEARLIHRRPLQPAVAIDTLTYGTYDRDQQDFTLPFPGWVLAEANNPPDGLIFRWPADSPISLDGNTLSAGEGGIGGASPVNPGADGARGTLN